MENVGASDSRDNQKKYFRSWSSYQIPMRPVGPVSYGETEALTSYYIAVYDGQGRLRDFTKMLKRADPAGSMDIPAVSPLNGEMYFAAVASSANGYRTGERISYAQTEHADRFFKGTLSQGSREMVIELVRVAVFFEEHYEYWPNGKLKSRISRKESGEIMRTTFDQSGKPER